MKTTSKTRESRAKATTITTTTAPQTKSIYTNNSSWLKNEAVESEKGDLFEESSKSLIRKLSKPFHWQMMFATNRFSDKMKLIFRATRAHNQSAMVILILTLSSSLTGQCAPISKKEQPVELVLIKEQTRGSIEEGTAQQVNTQLLELANRPSNQEIAKQHPEDSMLLLLLDQQQSDQLIESDQKATSIRRLIKRSGISDQRLAEIQMIRALKKQLERASKLAASNVNTGGQESGSS